MSLTAEAVDVSIVIPAYGRPVYLRELILSILAVRGIALEVIVIDDGSPEPIGAAISDLGATAPVRCIRQANAGVAAARNAGASLARGDFLMFVDDDDLVPEDSIGWRVQYLRANPSVAAVAGRCEFIRDGAVIDTEPVRWSGALTAWDLLVQNRFYSPGQVLIRRSAFERTSGCRLDCIGSDDWGLWIDLARVGPLVCDDRIALQYRLHGGNFSRNIATMTHGALRVVDGATSTLCRAHAAIGDSLAITFVDSVYAPKLAGAAAEARAAGDWRRVADVAKAVATLRWRVTAARARRKAVLLAHHRRWRMPDAELSALGRHCAECGGARQATPPRAGRLDSVHQPA